MNVEVDVHLDKFHLRFYQKPIFDAIEVEGYKRVLYIAPRRAGKDFLGWNMAIRQCIDKTCLVFYVLPTYSQARKCIWDAITIDGDKFLDFVPPMLVEGMNHSEMKIRFINGSILQCIGGDSYDTSLVGTNPYAVILSEYALMNPDIFSFIRPILAANGGWCLIQSTPRGKNHFWQLWKIAQELPEWKVIKQTASEIHHIPDEILSSERAQMDEGLYLQEYETSFDRGISGSYYGTYLDQLKLKGQICPVAWEPGLLTYTAWDIGVNDATTVIFFQIVGDGTIIRIIDCYSNNNLGLDHYLKIIQDKPYRYGKHFAPHDIKVREWGGGAVTRFEKARQLGLDFTLVDQVGIMDGIENVWTHFNKFWIDQDNCRSLINALENYRKEWDEKKQVYTNKPIHNWASNFCFTADTLVYTKDGNKPIIELSDKDFVMTLLGWKPCTSAQLIWENAELVEITFNDHTKVRCTPDHLFMTEKGWISARDLEKDLKILSYWSRESNILPELSIKTNQTINIIEVRMPHFIKLCGKMLSGMSRKIVTFITLIMINPITAYLTWCAWQLKNIVKCQRKEIMASVPNVGLQRLNGINLLKEENGIVNCQKNIKTGSNGLGNEFPVPIAEKSSQLLCEKTIGVDDIVIKTVAPLLVENVKCLRLREDVYCILVPEAGHFSLANGAIVKNCDALRYMCLAIHKTKRGMSSEEFERKKAEALYSDRDNLPRFFQNNPKYDRYR